MATLATFVRSLRFRFDVISAFAPYAAKCGTPRYALRPMFNPNWFSRQLASLTP